MADSSPSSGPRSRASKLAHWLRVTFTLRTDSNSEAIRAGTLACLFALGFLALGSVRSVPGAGFLADTPFDLDMALRTVSLGWYEPDRTIPIAIVDIDEETHRAWRSPASTPRDKLARLLEVVTAAAPAAVVVDIDLSGAEATAEDASTAVLREFLERYDQPAPLIFPKRIEPGVDGRRQMAASRFDDLFARNPKLAWAHASFAMEGGAVRHWSEWLAACAATNASSPETAHVPGDKTHADWLPAVPVRLAQMLTSLPPGLARPVAPSPRSTCIATDAVPTQRLLIGPRLTGEKRAARARDALAVSASLVLDPEVARDDARLFGQRVVLIGATHTGAEDFWLTPSGVLPGVELLANAVRFAPFKAPTGVGAGIAHRATTLLLFAMFSAAAWWLCGLIGVFASIVGALLIVAIAVGGWSYFQVFEALEAAIVLFVLYKATQALLDFIADLKDRRRKLPPGWRGALRALWAASVRE